MKKEENSDFNEKVLIDYKIVESLDNLSLSDYVLVLISEYSYSVNVDRSSIMRETGDRSIDKENLSWNERRFEGVGIENQLTRNEKKFMGIGDKAKLTKNEKKFMGIGDKDKLSRNEKKFLGISDNRPDANTELVDSEKSNYSSGFDKNNTDLMKTRESQLDSESTNKYKPDNLGHWENIPLDITPQENIDASNPNYEKGEEWQVNCQRCVPTFEMRSRGYDVTAQPCLDDNDYLAYHPFEVWEKPDVLSTKGDGMEDIQKQMEEWGDGSRAQVVVLWENGDGGHTFTAEQIEGKTVFVDPQNGDTDVEWYFSEAKNNCTRFCRIDNAQPTNYMLNCCDKWRTEK